MKKLKYLIIGLLLIPFTVLAKINSIDPYKYEYNMTINSDSSVDIEIIYGTHSEDLNNSICDDIMSKVGDFGFNVTSYSDDYNGCLINRHYDSIDEVTGGDITYDVTNLINGNISSLFKKDELYISNMIFDGTNDLDANSQIDLYNMSFNLNSYFDVSENNADIKESLNKLSWYINPQEVKTIDFKIDLNDNKTDINIVDDVKIVEKSNNTYLIVILSILGFLIVSSILVLIFRKKPNKDNCNIKSKEYEGIESIPEEGENTKVENIVADNIDNYTDIVKEAQDLSTPVIKEVDDTFKPVSLDEINNDVEIKEDIEK